MRDEVTNQLFVSCEECDAEWGDPTEARLVGSATRDAHPRARFVSAKELRGHAWGGFVLNR